MVILDASKVTSPSRDALKQNNNCPSSTILYSGFSKTSHHFQVTGIQYRP